MSINEDDVCAAVAVGMVGIAASKKEWKKVTSALQVPGPSTQQKLGTGLQQSSRFGAANVPLRRLLLVLVLLFALVWQQLQPRVGH